MTEGESSIKIGELLVRAGILTGVDLSEAEKLSKHMQLQFGRVLIMSGCLAERDLESALEAQALIRDGMVSADVAVQALHMSANEQISLQEALEFLNVVPKFGTATLELAELLADAAIISGEVLGETLQESLHTNASLGELLVEKKAMSPSLLPILNSMLELIRAGELVQADAVAEIRNTYYMWSAADQAVQRDPVAQSPVLSFHETPRFVTADQIHQAPPSVPGAPLQMPPVAHSTPGIPTSMEDFMNSFNEFAAQQYSMNPPPPPQPEYVASYSDQVYQEQEEAPAAPSIFDVLAVFQEKIASNEFGQALESATHLETHDALSSFEQAQREPADQAAELRERAYGVTHGGEVSAWGAEAAANGVSANAFERLRARQEQSSPPDGGWHTVDAAPVTSEHTHSGWHPVEESAAPNQAGYDREGAQNQEHWQQQESGEGAESGLEDEGSEPAEQGWHSEDAEPVAEQEWPGQETAASAESETTQPPQQYASAADYWHIYWDKDETPDEQPEQPEVAESTQPTAMPAEPAQSYETSDYWHIYWDKKESRQPVGVEGSESVAESDDEQIDAASHVVAGEQENSAANDWERAEEPAAQGSDEEPAEAADSELSMREEHDHEPDAVFAPLGQRDDEEPPEQQAELESESAGEEETFEPQAMNFEKPDDEGAAVSQAEMASAEKREPIRHPVEYAWTSETGLPSSSIAEPSRTDPEKHDRRSAEPSESIAAAAEDESTLTDIFENEEPEQSTFEPTSTVIELLIEGSHLQRDQIYQAYLRALQDDELSAKLLDVLGLVEKVAIEAASVCATALKDDRLNPDEAIEVLYAIKSGVDASEALAMAELSLPASPLLVVPPVSPADATATPEPATPEPRRRGRKATLSDISEVEDLSADQQTGSPQIFETGDFEPIPVRAARSKKARAAADPFAVMKAKKEAEKKAAKQKQEITLAKGLDAGASQWELEPIDEAKAAAIEAAAKVPEVAEAEEEWILAEVPTIDQWSRSDSAKVLDEITPVLDMVPIPEPVVLNFERTSPKNIDIVDEDAAPEPTEPTHRVRPGRKYPTKADGGEQIEAEEGTAEEPAESEAKPAAEVAESWGRPHSAGTDAPLETDAAESSARGESNADAPGSESSARGESNADAPGSESSARGESNADAPGAESSATGEQAPELGSEQESPEATEPESLDRPHPVGTDAPAGEHTEDSQEDAPAEEAEPQSEKGDARGSDEDASEEPAEPGANEAQQVISMIDDEPQPEPALAAVGSDAASTTKDAKDRKAKAKASTKNKLPAAKPDAAPPSDSVKKVADKKKPLKNRKKKH